MTDCWRSTRQVTSEAGSKVDHAAAESLISLEHGLHGSLTAVQLGSTLVQLFANGSHQWAVDKLVVVWSVARSAQRRVRHEQNATGCHELFVM